MYIIRWGWVVACVAAGLVAGRSDAAQESGFDLTLGRAVELHDAGGFDAAIQIYRSLREDRPRDPHLLYELARSLRATGDLAGCIQQADQSIASVSRWQPDAFALKARCEQENGAIDRALHTYAAAIGAHPGKAGLHFNYALALKAQGDYDEAEIQLRLALDMAGQEPALFLDYAALLAAGGDPAGALLVNLRFIIAAPQSAQAVAAAEAVQSLLDTEAPLRASDLPPAIFDGAYRTAQRAALGVSALEQSPADRLSHFLQRFVLESVATADSGSTGSILWASAVEPLLSLAEHDVLDAYLYFVAALARTDGSPEWLNAHRQKFERLVEYLARSETTS